MEKDNSNNNNPFKDILSEEELDQLNKIQAKVKAKFIEKFSNNTENLDSSKAAVDTSSPFAFDEINRPNHISNQDRELIFYIRGEISTIDFEQNKYLSLDKCLDESFHIPIPSGVNLDNKVIEFMKIFEQELGTLAKKINLPNNES